MKEIAFKIFRAEEGGYYARATGASIFTQAETLEELRLMIKDVIECRYGETTETPKIFNVVFEKS